MVKYRKNTKLGGVMQKYWKKNINLFLMGQFLSGITSMVVQYAIIWYLTQETGSATILSFATLLGMLPMVLLSPFVGPLIDRWDKKKLLIYTDIIVAIFALILSIVGTVMSTFPLWLVFVSLFIRSVAQTFQMPTIQSILPTMVPEEELTRINGRLGMVQSANYIVAPGLGAFLFAAVPMNALILLDVLGAILGVGLLILVVIPKMDIQGEAVHLLADTKFGVKKLYEKRGLWHIMLNGAVFMLLFMPAASLYPLMTMGYFNGTVGQAGLIEVIYAVGMLVGGAIIGFSGHFKNRMQLVIISYIVLGVSVTASGLLPATSQGFIYFVLLNALAGLATPYYNTLVMAMIQQSFEPSILGRVLGVFNSLMSLPGPIGLIFAGPLADALGVEKLFVIAGVGTLLCAIALYLVPSARNYDLELQSKHS
ncbi:MFS transporter [Enterococcus mundtii]|uniref:MFS transporter n=1 Tax=Enterococcus mundtii TaxID=53346 RepID=UPI0023514DD7|nr:MFS transporter [Enterococcus mundtii]